MEQGNLKQLLSCWWFCTQQFATMSKSQQNYQYTCLHVCFRNQVTPHVAPIQHLYWSRSLFRYRDVLDTDRWTSFWLPKTNSSHYHMEASIRQKGARDHMASSRLSRWVNDEGGVAATPAKETQVDPDRAAASEWTRVIHFETSRRTTTYCDVLRHMTTYYDVLRRTTTYYDVLRRMMTYYDVLRRITTHYDVLRRTITY